MIVRQLDINGDWTFGQGLNNYLRAGNCTEQNIGTRLQMFLGDCFFDSGAGLDWDTLLGGGDQTALGLAVFSVIVNTPEVTKVTQLNIGTDPLTRRVTVTYQCETIYSTLVSATTSFTV